MEKDLATQVSELRGLLLDYQRGTNRTLHGIIRASEGMNALDDYRGQQIAALEAQVSALSAAVRASFADPVDVAERMLRSVDDDSSVWHEVWCGTFRGLTCDCAMALRKGSVDDADV